MICEIAISAFVGAIAGVLVDLIYKIFLEKKTMFFLQNCDAILLYPNISIVQAEELFQSSSIRPKFIPIWVGTTMYWGMNFKDGCTLSCSDIIDSTSGFVYITKRGNRLIQKEKKGDK